MSIEEAVRRSHCAHAESSNPEHRCVGICTITPKGIDLRCALCGSEELPRHQFAESAVKRARDILAAAGFTWSMLSDDAQAQVIREVLRTMCPGCGLELPAVRYAAYYVCPCERYRHYADTWESAAPK